MRFKAWDLEGKCWIPTDQVLIDGDGKIFTREGNGVIRETIPIVIVRCTGYRDPEGTMIFDGDIFRISDREKVYVEWNNKKNTFEVKNWDSYTTGYSIAWISKVPNSPISGNVFENLEEFSQEFRRLYSQWKTGKTTWQKKAYLTIKNIGSNRLIYGN